MGQRSKSSQLWVREVAEGSRTRCLTQRAISPWHGQAKSTSKPAFNFCKPSSASPNVEYSGGDIVDGLYWKFIDKNIKFFESNPRLSVMTRSLAKMEKDRKKIIFMKAEEFIEKNTT